MINSQIISYKFINNNIDQGNANQSKSKTNVSAQKPRRSYKILLNHHNLATSLCNYASNQLIINTSVQKTYKKFINNEKISKNKQIYQHYCPDLDVRFLENYFKLDVGFCQAKNSVKEIQFKYNQLRLVPILLSKNCSISVRKLDLSHNKISTLKSRTLPENYPGVEDLNLSFNRLTYLEGREISDGENSLRKLNLTSNRISTLTPTSFTRDLTKNLEILDLKSNRLKQTLDFKKLLIDQQNQEQQSANFESLKYLDLSNNRYTRIVSLAFKNCMKLQILDLSRNRVFLIEDGAFYVLGERKLQDVVIDL